MAEGLEREGKSWRERGHIFGWGAQSADDDGEGRFRRGESREKLVGEGRGLGLELLRG